MSQTAQVPDVKNISFFIKIISNISFIIYTTQLSLSYMKSYHYKSLFLIMY